MPRQPKEPHITGNIEIMYCPVGHYTVICPIVYRIYEGGLNSKLAANRDVIEYPLAMH